MPTRECYHCKQMIEEGAAHDCWTTTEAALTRDLSEDLQEAWERLRESAAELGEQRIYASHNSIMFSRKSCYCFVRPKKSFLEVCIFLGRAVKAPQIRRVDRSSKTKLVHFLRVTHRDEVEAPLTDWLEEAYHFSGAIAGQTARPAPSVALPKTPPKSVARKAAKPKPGPGSKPKPKATRTRTAPTTGAARASKRR